MSSVITLASGGLVPGSSRPGTRAAWHRGRRCGPGRGAAAARPVPRARRDVIPRGVIGGAVIEAARQSAGLTRRRLAREMGVTPSAVRAWETGTAPIYRLGYDQLGELARIFGQASEAPGPDLADLLLAGQCDLLMAGMVADFEDYAEVPPVDQDEAGAGARELLRWALTSYTPGTVRGHARKGPLLGEAVVRRFTAAAFELASGCHGDELAVYGSVLLALAEGSRAVPPITAGRQGTS